MGSAWQILLPRLGRAAVTLWLVLTVVFVVLRFSGDPVRLLLPSDAPEAQVAALRVRGCRLVFSSMQSTMAC